MNYLTLTHNQVEQIQKTLPLFDDEEIRYNGAVKLCPEPDDCYSITIDWLEVKILGKWYALFDRERKLNGAIFDLTDEQHDEIKNTLLNTNYD